MKKLLILLTLSLLATACGPKRLGCGPNRCSIETPQTIASLKNIC